MNTVTNIKGSLIVIIISCFTLSCNLKRNNTQSEFAGVIEVDDQNINKVSFKDLFSDVRLIPLDTKPEAAIKQADKIIFHCDRFYILDKDQASVLVFSSAGKYLFKIQSVGRGPGEYSLLYDITINEFRNTIELLNPRGQIMAYDLDGTFIDKTAIPVRACQYFQYLNSDTIILYTKFDPKKLAYFSKRKNEVVYTLFSFPDFILETPLIQMSTPFVKYNNDLLFYQGFSNTIYSLKGTEMNERFTWNFGKHNLDLKDFPKDESMQYYINYLKKCDYVWGFTNYAENEKLIITRFIYDQNIYCIVYNKQKKDHLLVRKVSEDVYFPAVYVLTDDKLITSIEPSKIQLILKPGMLDEQEARIYRSINPEDNPVIVIYTLK
jgi:hypothetical protein